MMALFKRILNFTLLVLQRTPSSLVPYAATKHMSRDRAKNKGEKLKGLVVDFFS